MRLLCAVVMCCLPGLAPCQGIEFQISGSATMEFPSRAVIVAVTEGADNPLEITAGFVSLWCERAADFTGQQLDPGTSYTFTAEGGPVTLSISFDGGGTGAPAGGAGEQQVPADGSLVRFDGKMTLYEVLAGGEPCTGTGRLTVSVDGEGGYEIDYMPASDAIGLDVSPGHEYSFTTSSLQPVVLVFRPGAIGPSKP